VSEASFWNYLRKLLPKEGHYTRIESHDTAAGFPDVHYTLYGNSGTIELKDAKRPGAKYPFSRESGLRSNQLRWIGDEIKADGQVSLALQCGDRIYLLRADCYYYDLRRMTEEEIARVARVQWKKGDKLGKSGDNAYSLELQLADFLGTNL
jgi:hypothetical protein